jgi:hypothetical protein
MRWAVHVAHTGEVRSVRIFWLQNLNGRDHLEELGVDGKIMLEFILWKWGERVWIGFIYLGIWISGGPL